MGEYVDRLADRLTAVVWDNRAATFERRIALMREHQRRMWLWGTTLTGHPFHVAADVAKELAPEVGMHPLVAPPVLETVRRNSHSYYAEAIAEAALYFEALRDRNLALPDLPHPYAAVIAMFEAGGSFHFDCAGISIEIEADEPWNRAGLSRRLPERFRTEVPVVADVPEM